MKHIYDYTFYELGKFYGKRIYEKGEKNNLTLETKFNQKWEKLSDIGYFKMIVPQKYGGLELNYKDMVEFTIGLGYGAEGENNLFSANVQVWACIAPIIKFASENLIKCYIPRLMSPHYICAHAISEENAGSSVFDMEMTYEKNEYGYILNGTKKYVTNAPVANCFIIYAKEKCDLYKKNPQITCFLVEKDSSIVIGKRIDKMGLTLSPMSNIYLKNCLVDDGNILGRLNQGRNIFNYTMALERTFLLAYQIGIMEKQLEKVTDFVKKRTQGGKKIIEYQSVSNRLADMKVNLEASKLFIKSMTKKLSNGEDIYLDSSIAKLFVSDALVENCYNAMKNYGTVGYTDDLDISRNLCDALGSQFYSGTSDIQRHIISSLL